MAFFYSIVKFLTHLKLKKRQRSNTSLIISSMFTIATIKYNGKPLYILRINASGTPTNQRGPISASNEYNVSPPERNVPTICKAFTNLIGI